MSEQEQQTQSATPEQPVTPSTQAPGIKEQIAKVQDSIRNAPTNISNAIEEGKGDDVIGTLQDLVTTIVTSVFSCCQIITLQLLLIGKKDIVVLQRNVYVIAGISVILLAVLCLIEFSWSNIILAGVFLLSAFITNNFILKTGHKPQCSKPRDNDSDDIIL